MTITLISSQNPEGAIYSGLSPGPNVALSALKGRWIVSICNWAKRWGVLAPLVVGGFIAATPANANVIFDNIDDPYHALTATTLLGMEFIPSQSGKLQSIEFPFAINPQKGPKNVVVSLYSGPQISLLETWNVTVSNSIAFNGSLALTTLTSQTLTDLIAGNDYWVFLFNSNYSNTDPGVSWGWDSSPSGATYSSFGGGGYDPVGSPQNRQFGVRVNATVPEPLSCSVFGAGLAGIFAVRRRRKMAA